MTNQYQESLDVDALTRYQAKLTLLGLCITLFAQISSYMPSSEVKQPMVFDNYIFLWNISPFYRELHTNYSVICLIYIFRYHLSIQIACRCVDGWSNSVATTQLPRFVSLSYQDTRRLYSRKNGKLQSLASPQVLFVRAFCFEQT